MGSFSDIFKQTILPSLAGSVLNKLPLTRVFGQQTGGQLQTALQQSLSQKYAAYPGAGPVGMLGIAATAASASPGTGFAQPPALPALEASGMSLRVKSGSTEVWENRTGHSLRIAGNNPTEGFDVGLNGRIYKYQDGRLATGTNATSFANIGYVVPTRQQAGTVYQAPPPPPTYFGGQPGYTELVNRSPPVEDVLAMGRDLAAGAARRADAGGGIGAAALVLLAFLLFAFGGRR